jgi:hypothetical protein
MFLFSKFLRGKGKSHLVVIVDREKDTWVIKTLVRFSTYVEGYEEIVHFGRSRCLGRTSIKLWTSNCADKREAAYDTKISYFDL